MNNNNGTNNLTKMRNRKLKVLVLMALVCGSVWGQGYVKDENNAATSIYSKEGKIGIGTILPNALLDIKMNGDGRGLQIIGENKQVDLHLGHDGNAYGYYWRYKGIDTGNNNDLELWSNNQGNEDKQVYNIHQDGNIRFYNQVSIGYEAKPGYKLAVNGSIIAAEIKVEAQTADFVFEDDYNLKDLSEVESFILTNKHLPDIPSAAEMEEQGVNLAEMNKLLLQKVEELTLYAIEQKAEVERQKEGRKKLEEEISSIKNQLTVIKELLNK